MTIQQETLFDADLSEVFSIFTDSEAFAGATGVPASIDATAGGAFSCFGGQITGRIIELVSNERLIQAWRVEAWPPGVFSLVSFTFAATGNKTKVSLEHSAYPEEAKSQLEQGWQKMYWAPIRTQLTRDKD